MRLMFYGDARVTPELEDKAMTVFSNILMNSRIERKTRNVLILLEHIIEFNILHPRIIGTIERILSYKIQVPFILDIVQIAQLARKCNSFSD